MFGKISFIVIWITFIRCLLLPVLIKDDLSRRNVTNSWLFWSLTFIPLFGTLVYLCLRPPLETDSSSSPLLRVS
ncbi:MAG: hypothetical protein QNJ41_02580 [Xenococcaceae cyanobacterium MO_188.B32]|nr:hypothetical protein [Xenococcaceae cyanobacterium MO_188.B32]